jgi:hypothetical protein
MDAGGPNVSFVLLLYADSLDFAAVELNPTAAAYLCGSLNWVLILLTVATDFAF